MPNGAWDGCFNSARHENFRVAVGNAVTVPALRTIPFNASYSNNTYGRYGHVQPYSLRTISVVRT